MSKNSKRIKLVVKKLNKIVRVGSKQIYRGLKNRRLVLGTASISLVIIIAMTALSAFNVTNQFTAAARADLPTGLLDNASKTVTVTDRQGQVLYYLYNDTNRLITEGDKIAEYFKDALIAAEDERFFYHNGVDIQSIIRAMKANYQEKSIVSGGSTLTMQLVKNMTGDDRQSWHRKVKEAYLATVIESRYSKKEILTAYANLVPLGNNLGGVETASRFYFDKPASELTLPEAATLAALPTSPEYYATNPEALKQRRDYVLRRMLQTGKINKEELTAATATDTPIKKPVLPLLAPHFSTMVGEQLKERYGDKLYTGGFKVTTTLDWPTHQLAEEAVRDNFDVLAKVGARNVGLVSLDPKTGQVLAMVGSADWRNKNNKGEVNFTTANLSYGSTLKPLIFALLLERNGWSPGAIMWDVKTNFRTGEPKHYTPQNYDKKFFGPMTVRQALANSRNIPAIKALHMVGLGDVLKRLEEMGISSLGTDTSKYGLSLAVGGGGIPLIEMTGAYTALANEGRVNPAEPLLTVTDYKGKTHYESKPLNRQVLKPEVAYEIAEILQDNEARKRVFGPSSQLVVANEQVAAKTGTAEDYRSALTIGFTPEIVTGVIVANNNNEPMHQNAGGAMAAAPFWQAFMKRYLADRPNTWFNRPDSVKEVRFATVIGQVNDLVAPWQNPSDRFTRKLAETNDPLWQFAINAWGTKPISEDSKTADSSENTRDEDEEDQEKKKEKQARGRR